MRNRTRLLGIALIAIGVVALFGQLGGNRWEHGGRRGMAARGEMPAMPEMPEMAEMPAMPEMPRFDHHRFNGFHHDGGPWIGGQVFKVLAVLLVIGLFMGAKRRRDSRFHDRYQTTIHRF